MPDAPEQVEWLTATLDQVEQAAKLAILGEWAALDDESQPGAATESERDRADRVHIALHDPRMELFRVEADRWTLRQHQPGTRVDDPDEPWVKCVGHEWVAWPCDTFRNLLRAYRYMPGFKEEWLR